MMKNAPIQQVSIQQAVVLSQQAEVINEWLETLHSGLSQMDVPEFETWWENHGTPEQIEKFCEMFSFAVKEISNV